MAISAPKTQDITVTGRVTAEFAQILTTEALDFIAKLHRQFEPRREELLARRAARQKDFDAGKLPDFLPETRQVRENEWRIAAQPKDRQRRSASESRPIRCTNIADSSLPIWEEMPRPNSICRARPHSNC